MVDHEKEHQYFLNSKKRKAKDYNRRTSLRDLKSKSRRFEMFGINTWKVI